MFEVEFLDVGDSWAKTLNVARIPVEGDYIHGVGRVQQVILVPFSPQDLKWGTNGPVAKAYIQSTE